MQTLIYWKLHTTHYLAAPRPTSGNYLGDSLTHPMLITAFLHIRPEAHREPRSEVGSLSLAERLAGFEPGTFQFWSQRLNPLGHSPHLQYGTQLWGNKNSETIATFPELQHRALRKITFKKRHDRISCVYKECKILKFPDILNLQNCLFLCMKSSTDPNSVPLFLLFMLKTSTTVAVRDQQTEIWLVLDWVRNISNPL